LEYLVGFLLARFLLARIPERVAAARLILPEH
jgi:hypothetical protein